MEKESTKVVTEPGIYKDITIEDYHADKSWVSSTGLKHAKRSMSEYRLYLDGYWDDETKSHFDFGNACELYLLDPALFLEKVAIAPESEWLKEVLEANGKLVNPRASKHFKELRDEFLEENEGKYIIMDVGNESMETIKIIAARCMNDEWISLLLNNVQYQNSLYWIDKASGVKCKTRPDMSQIRSNSLVNIKTTTDASPEAFSRDLAKLSYPLQACMEIAGTEATGLMDKVEHYFWLVIEKEPPFNVQLYEFDMGDVNVLMDDLHFILRQIARCQEQNIWPGYGLLADNKYGILKAKIPVWYKTFENFA